MKNILIISLLLSLSFIGCGSGNIPLRGTVTFADDNSPLPVGMLVFENETHRCRAELKPDGTFIAGTVRAKDGIPPGTYTVAIAGARKEGGPKDDMGSDLGIPLIHTKYENASTSGLTAVVDGSANVINFQVERSGK